MIMYDDLTDDYILDNLHVRSDRKALIETLRKRAKAAGHDCLSSYLKGVPRNDAPKPSDHAIPKLSQINGLTRVGPVLDAIANDKVWNFQNMGDEEFEEFARDFCNNDINDMAELDYEDLTPNQQKSFKMIIQKRARYYAAQREA